jgi:hypothetical protein
VTVGSAAIFLLSMAYVVASVASLPHNDIAIQSPKGESELKKGTVNSKNKITTDYGPSTTDKKT